MLKIIFEMKHCTISISAKNDQESFILDPRKCAKSAQRREKRKTFFLYLEHSIVQEMY